VEPITRQSVLDLLAGDWAEYVACFQALAPAGQADFLQQQGFKRLADLLAHIVAWWEVGMQTIPRFQSDPAAQPAEIDVDRFNAQAVEQVRTVSDGEEVQVFEQVRHKFSDFVRRLSEDDFKDERILTQFKWELVSHLEDHRIK
jgi:hypothetical protein